MKDDDFHSHDLTDPAARASVLASIPPERASAARRRTILLSIFKREMEYRREDDGDSGYFENVYWCAFLLYLAGDPADAVLLWKAKHLKMDTGCGLDGQSLVGAGIEKTIRYLEAKGENRIVDYIRRMQESGDLEADALADWEKGKAQYFYAT